MVRPDPQDERRRRLCRAGALAPLAGIAAGALALLPAGTRAQAVAPSGPAAPATPVAPSASAAAEAPPAVAAAAAPAAATPDPQRLALVIGNRRYPGNFELPSIHTNALLMQQALQQRGFQATLQLDAGPDEARQAVDRFIAQVQAAPAEATAFFYFSGHGLQIEAENLLVAAGVAPDAGAEQLRRGSLTLMRDVVRRLPSRPLGLTVVVMDACRTGPARLQPGAGPDGANQEEALPGCLIAFSTAAGKPALAPIREDLATFFTGALVQQLQTAPDDLSFSLLFKAVRLEVVQAMSRHPARQIRANVQVPYISDDVRVAVPVASLAQRQAQAQAQRLAQAQLLQREAQGRQAQAERERAEEDQRWAELQASVWPPEVLRRAEAFLQRPPTGPLGTPGSRAVEARVAAQGAREAAAILRRNDVRLYRSSFLPDAQRDTAYNADLQKAARGDKDAAARIGRHWAGAPLTGPEPSRYEGWMQFAAELGNGIASYELALHYRRRNQPEPAARWEARARALGYTPPPSLEQYRK